MSQICFEAVGTQFRKDITCSETFCSSFGERVVRLYAVAGCAGRKVRWEEARR